MTVVLSRNYYMYPTDPVCTVCGDRQCHPPFVQWRTHADDLILCTDCCRNLHTGLVADMVQVVAIGDLRALSPHYHGQTLTRSSQGQVDAAAAADKASILGCARGAKDNS